MVRTITVTDEAYERLKNHKMEGESFTDVIKREFSKKKSIAEFAGAWGHLTEKEIAEIRKSVKDVRSRLSKDLLERRNKLFK